MSPIPSNDFSNDLPLSDKVDDMLNRAPFAEHVAEVLRGLPRGTSLVVGIHGPWGDGKTTVLNILRSDLDADESIATVEFNPWRFTDEPSMLTGFFRVLAGVVRAKLTTKGEDIAGRIETIARYASILDDRFGKAGEIAGSKAEASLEDLRLRLSEALAQADKRIIILMDDIDRLDKHETHTLFRLIKACADFPNVCYVLAFDDVAVAKSLGEQYGAGDEASGRAFLEKIIQVPLKLPIAMREDLRSLCFQQVDRALTAAHVELSREEIGRYYSQFERSVSIRLATPRQARRYGNGLMFALPMLNGEVNIVDLLLIEAVRAFYPAIYDVVRANHTEFAGVESEHMSRGHDGPRAAALLKSVVDALPSEESNAIKSLLKDLFPKLAIAYGGARYGTDWFSSWAKAKRICSPDYCSRYFSYTIPKSDVRDSEMDELYRKAGTGAEADVREMLEGFFAAGKARRIIQRMRDRADDTESTAVCSLCPAVASLARHIPNTPSLLSFAEPPTQAAMLISDLVRRLPPGAGRVEASKRVIAVADPLWFGAEVLRWLYVTDETEESDRNTLAKGEIQEVGKALVERIKGRAEAGEPLFNIEVPQEQSLLFEWRCVEGRDPVQAHLSSVFARDPKSIALFLQAMAPKSWGEGNVFPRVGTLDGNQLKKIKWICDLDMLADLICKHLPGDFEHPQWIPDYRKPVEERLAEQFMYVYNKWKQDGEPSEISNEHG